MSLRPPLTAYQTNGLPVQGNTVLITSSNGAAIFSNTVNLSTAYLSTLNSNYISSNIISTNAIDANTINANAINANIINANAIDASTINVDVLSTSSHFTSTISTASIYTGYLEANKALISNPTLTNWDNAALIVNNTVSIVGDTTADSQLILHNGNSRLGADDPYTGLFIEAAGANPIYFSAYGGSPQYAFIGPQSTTFNGSVNIASTLNVRNISTSNININNLSTNSISTNTININDGFINNLSTNIINMNNGIINSNDNTVLRLSTTNNIDMYSDGLRLYNPGDDSGASISLFNDKASIATNNPYDGIYIEASDNKPIRLCNTDNVITYANFGSTSNIIYANTTIESNNPNTETFLQVTNTSNISSISKIGMTAGDMSYALYTTDLEGNSNGLIPSTFQIYSYNPGNMGTPVLTIYPNGDITNYGYLSTNTVNMNNGQITGLSSINGSKYPPEDDAFWSGSLSGNIYNDNTGFVGIGTSDPNTLLQVGSKGAASYYNNSNIQSTIIYGPAIYPSTSFDPSATAFNFPSGLMVASVSTNITEGGVTNYGSGIVLGGKLIFDSSIAALARIGGVCGNNSISGDFTIETLSQTSGSTAGLIEHLRVKSNGNVGIRTNSPQYTLDINGDTHTSGYLSTNTVNMNNGQITGLSSITSNVSISGYAISKVSVTYANSGTTLDSSYWGKYVFANSGDVASYSLTLGTVSVSDGTIIVIRNAAATTNSITINGVYSGPTTILPTKTTSYIYTDNPNVTAGWYAL